MSAHETELQVDPTWAEALDRIRNMNLVMGLALAREGKLLHNLLPYSRERAEALAGQVQEITNAHHHRCPNFDHLWFGFSQVQLLVTVLGSWQLIVLHQGLEPLDFLAGLSRLFLTDHCHPNVTNEPSSNAFMGNLITQNGITGPIPVTRVPADRTNFRSRRQSEAEREKRKSAQMSAAPPAPVQSAPAAPHLRPGFLRSVPPPIPPPPPPPPGRAGSGSSPPPPQPPGAQGLSSGWRSQPPQPLRPSAPPSPAQRASGSSSPPLPPAKDDLPTKETQRIPLPMLRRNNTPPPSEAPPPNAEARWQAFRFSAVRLTASFSNFQEAEHKVAGLCEQQGIPPHATPTREQLQTMMESLIPLAPSHVYGDIMRRELTKLLGPAR